MQRDVWPSEAARAIYDACFTLAPIPFEEAARRQTLHYQRAMKAAHDVMALAQSARAA